MSETRLGITHRSRRIALDGTEVPLSLDEAVAHRPRLSHVYQCRVNRGLTVRVVVTGGITTDLRTFPVVFAGSETEVIHRQQNPALRRLQSIAHVGQSPRNDNRHRVVEKRARHFIGNRNGFDVVVRSVIFRIFRIFRWSVLIVSHGERLKVVRFWWE